MGLAEAVAEGVAISQNLCPDASSPSLYSSPWELAEHRYVYIEELTGGRRVAGSPEPHLSQSAMRADQEGLNVASIDHPPSCGDQGELAVPVTR
jgi:hypothetical protein